MKRVACSAMVLSLLLFGHATRADLFDHQATAETLAATLLAEPARQVAQAQVMRGKFVHRKHLSDIPAPLESDGEFVFVREHGLYWHTLKPFESVFVLTPRGMFQRDEGGKAIATDASDQPGIRAAAAIFMALFAVDLPALDKEFAMFGEPTGRSGEWRLGLRPKNKAMTSVFKEAVVTGAAQVREVEIKDGQGDRTIIKLSNTTLLNRAPTAAELALLNLSAR